MNDAVETKIVDLWFVFYSTLLEWGRGVSRSWDSYIVIFNFNKKMNKIISYESDNKHFRFHKIIQGFFFIQ